MQPDRPQVRVWPSHRPHTHLPPRPHTLPVASLDTLDAAAHLCCGATALTGLNVSTALAKFNKSEAMPQLQGTSDQEAPHLFPQQAPSRWHRSRVTSSCVWLAKAALERDASTSDQYTSSHAVFASFDVLVTLVNTLRAWITSGYAEFSKSLVFVQALRDSRSTESSRHGHVCLMPLVIATGGPRRTSRKMTRSVDPSSSLCAKP